MIFNKFQFRNKEAPQNETNSFLTSNSIKWSYTYVSNKRFSRGSPFQEIHPTR
jgi:hypothetical protein